MPLVAGVGRKLAITVVGGAVGAGIYTYTHENKKASELNTSSFTPFKLLSREPVSSTSSILTLQSSYDLKSLSQKFNQSSLWSLEIKQPQLQIARSYTPLPPLDIASETTDEIRFLVRRETRGEVSSYLHRLPIGANIELRGPTDDYTLPNDVDQVIFLAGGTGIAPALQVAHSLQDKARLAIVWANRRREDCLGGQSDHGEGTVPWYLSTFGRQASQQVATSRHPIVEQLQSLKTRSGSLEVDYYVDDESTYITPKRIEQLMHTKTTGSRLIIVSGPDGFVNYWAGPKIWTNGQQVQGPLGGHLGRMDLDGWRVIKL